MSEQAFLSLEKFDVARDYWLDKLSGELTEARIAPDLPAIGEYKAAEIETALPDHLQETLLHMSNNNDISLYVILLGVLKMLLSKVVDTDDTIVISPCMKNSDQDYNQFIPLRDVLTGSMNFKQVLMAVKQTVMDGYKHQYYPIGKLNELLALDDGVSIFRVVLLLENIHKTDYIDTFVREYPNDFIFFFNRGNDGVSVKLRYNGATFSSETVHRLLTSFQHLLDQALEHKDLPLEQLEYVPSADRRWLLDVVNDTAHEFPAGATIHSLVEEQAQAAPDSVALVFKGMFVTYGALDGNANRLARHLSANGVGQGTPVAVMAGRSVEMMVALLAVLKAGGYYLPLDTEYPRGRIEYVLRDSGAELLLIQKELKRFVDLDCPVIEIDDPAVAVQNDSPLPNTVDLGSLAYLIYTSGTTGKPKGVLVPHKGAVNTLCCRREEYRMAEDDVSMQLFSYTFDGFITSFFTPLISGSRVVILGDEEILDIRVIKQSIVKHRVSHFICVPPLFQGIIENLEPADTHSLKIVTLAGDAIQKKLLDQAKEKNPKLEIANEYGVTEVSVMSTIHRHQQEKEAISIGNPVWNTSIYILNRHGQLQLPGLPGEMCIAGAGVASGYQNNLQLTAEKFVADPFKEGEIQYKTGDLARWRLDGTIEFFGRIDQQVKVRGYRIELGEVENRLLDHPQVTDGVVVVKENKSGSQRFLCAYFVGTNGVDANGLRGYLAEELPDYMIPSHFVPLEKIPLTPTGKLDRNSLPEPEVKSSEDYVAPENEIEEQLVDVWAEILELDKEVIGVNDNFFELGGNSLKIIQVNSRLNEIFKRDIPVVTLFEHSSVAALSGYLQGGAEDTQLKEQQQEEKLDQVEEEVQNTLDIFSNF
jgi:amino acid adenylation domain-containing protein